MQSLALTARASKKPNLISKSEEPQAWQQATGGSLSQKRVNQRI